MKYSKNSKNKLSKNTLSKNKLSKNTLSKNKLSKNKLSKNKLSKNKLSKKFNTKPTTKSYKKHFWGGAEANTTEMVGEEAGSEEAAPEDEITKAIENYEEKLGYLQQLWSYYSAPASKYRDIELSDEHYNLIFFGDQMENHTNLPIKVLAMNQTGRDEFFDIRIELKIKPGMGPWGLMKESEESLRAKIIREIGLKFTKKEISSPFMEHNTVLNTRNAAEYTLDTSTLGGRVFYRIVWLTQIYETLAPLPHPFFKKVASQAQGILWEEVLEYSRALLEDDYNDTAPRKNPVGDWPRSRRETARQVETLHNKLWGILDQIGEEITTYTDKADESGGIWGSIKAAAGILKMGLVEIRQFLAMQATLRGIL